MERTAKRTEAYSKMNTGNKLNGGQNMYTHLIDGISVSTILDKRRLCSNGTDYPIRIRVNWNKKKKYYSTGKACTPKAWERLPNAKSKDMVELRKEIQMSFSIIKSHVLELHAKDDFSLDNLDRSLRRISGETLNSLLKQKIELLRKNGQIGTKVTYETTLSNITKFRGEQIAIESITENWLINFEKFMLCSNSVASLGIHMRNIRAIMNIAKKTGLIKDKQYPFGRGKYEIKKAEGIKKALTSVQIKKIIDLKIDDDTLARFRDLFIFIYLCNGINIADLTQLKYKNIIDGELCFIREKTKRTNKNVKFIKAPITKEVQDIIDRWGNEPLPDNYIFKTIKHTNNPEVSYNRKKTFTKQFNQKIKCIGTAVGIYDITSYTARHSFATVLKRKGVNIAFISESLGHTSLNTTQTYLDSFEKEERQKNAKLLSEL